MNANAPAPVPVMSERRVSIIGALLVAVGPVSMAIYTPAMPEIVHAFGTTEAAVKLTLSLYFAGFAIAQLFCGPLSDGLGRKPVTFGFLAIYLAASIMALFAPTVEVLIVARFLQGVGAAVGVAISRAIVRDLFHGDTAIRIFNLTGIILAVGPAFSPALGGMTMQLAGWHAIFILMVIFGLVIVAVTHFSMRETVVRDLSRIRPGALLHTYSTLLCNPYFMLSSIVLTGSIGALYTQATVLPFILIGRVGLSPTQFGLAMLMQSGAFLAGSLVVRAAMRRMPTRRMVPIGILCVAVGSLCIAIVPRTMEPSFLSIMGPVAVYAFGIAFVMPSLTVAAMAPFPHVAGAAASMNGFLQMGGGLLGGSLAALIGDPVIAFATIIPAMGAIALLSWLVWRMLPEPPAFLPDRTI